MAPPADSLTTLPYRRARHRVRSYAESNWQPWQMPFGCCFPISDAMAERLAIDRGTRAGTAGRLTSGGFRQG